MKNRKKLKTAFNFSLFMRISVYVNPLIDKLIGHPLNLNYTIILLTV